MDQLDVPSPLPALPWWSINKQSRASIVVKHCWAVSSKNPWPPLLFHFPWMTGEDLAQQLTHKQWVKTTQQWRDLITRKEIPTSVMDRMALSHSWFFSRALHMKLIWLKDSKSVALIYFLKSGLLLHFHCSHGSAIASRLLAQRKVRVFSWTCRSAC